MNDRQKFEGTQIQRLLKGQKGTVHYEVWGFRVPFRIVGVQFFRLQVSTIEPGKFDRVYQVRENDLIHVEGAAKLVRKWRKEFGP